MATAKLLDRVKMSVSGTPGTGSITLGSAAAKYQSVTGAGGVNGDTLSYLLDDGLNWETGLGTYNAGVLSRDTVLASSASGAKISATATATVYITVLSQDLQSGTAANQLVRLNGSAKLPAVDGSLLTNLAAAAVVGLATVATTGVYSSLSGLPTLGSLAALSSINNSNWSGTQLSVANGGTGLTSLTAGYIPFGNGTGALGDSANLFWDNTNGRLGIGTSSPSDNISFGRAVDINSTSGAGYYARVNGSVTNYVSLGIDTVAAYLWNNANTPLRIYTNGTERLRIDASGNVGIGTTSPNATLTIVGTSTSAIQIKSTSGASSGFKLYNDSAVDTAYLMNNYSGPMVFGTANTERMRIDASGNLLVGTTSTSESSGAGLKVLNTGGTVASVSGASTSSQSNWEMYSTGAGAFRFYVGWNGTINATSTTISAISDRRFKENIVDLDVGLDALLTLKPRKFDWKSGKGKDIKGDRGWIADEFQQVFPDLIDTWKDAPPQGEEPYKSVRPDLMPVVVKAIQELAAKVSALEARI